MNITSGVECGYFVVEQDDRALCLKDFVICPVYQGRGIGSTILRNLQQRTAVSGVPLHLHVLRHYKNAGSVRSRREDQLCICAIRF
ncbi:MAG TPA: hypothetical protein GXX29_14510 [Firmicutes bacterium]|nr:hypothetical protein [Bacillota bacterium]